MKFLIMQIFQAPVTSSFMGCCHSHLPQHPAFDLHLFFYLRDQTLHPTKQQIILYFCVF